MGAKIKTIRASEVTPLATEWLWEGVIPRGMLSSVQGSIGTGKSYLTCKLAAEVSRGGELPTEFGTHQIAAGRVLLANSDDDVERTTVKRLINCGANRDNIVFIDPGDRVTFADSRLRGLFAELKPTLAIFDPLCIAIHNGSYGLQVIMQRNFFEYA
jgi:hypothetical protein